MNKYRNPDQMAEALDADPPKITWRTTKGGVKVAVEVVDPHAEGSQWKRRNDPAEPCLEYVDISDEPEGESPLLKAARTDI